MAKQKSDEPDRGRRKSTANFRIKPDDVLGPETTEPSAASPSAGEGAADEKGEEQK